MSSPTKKSIAFLEGSLDNCPFAYHPLIAISGGGFFVPRERLTERFNDWFTKHTPALPDFATAKTKLSLCERGHVARNLPASGVNARHTRVTLQRFPLHEIVSDIFLKIEGVKKSGITKRQGLLCAFLCSLFPF